MNEMRQKPYSNKKILILGANNESIDLIKQAQKLGAFVYVADHNPHAPAKAHADKPVNINGLDTEALTSFCLLEKIDAVLVGVADRLVKPYYKLCKNLNLPCYVSELSAEVLTDKIKFNTICKQFGIPTIPGYTLKEEECVGDIEYPCFVKPPDGNSGKGMSVCYHAEELSDAIEKARKNSQTGRYYIDRYMDTDDMFVYFTIANGNVYLSATADRFTCRSQAGVSKVCLGGVYPSKYNTLFKANMFDRFVSMINFLEIKNGVLMVSAFVENNNFYFYDPGFRLQGEAPNKIIAAANNINQMELLIHFAFTGKMDEKKLLSSNDAGLDGLFGASVWFLLKEGKIAKIKKESNDSEIKWIDFSQRLYEGDYVLPEMVGTEAQVLARAYLLEKSQEQLKKRIKETQQCIEVADTLGNNMLLEGFEYE